MNKAPSNRDLFGWTSRTAATPIALYPNAPGHRNVETSIAAAAALAPKLGRLQAMALEAIREAGARGLTADELAARLGLDRYSIQPRTSELNRKGLICDSGLRRPNATGKQAIVWVAAPCAHSGES